MWKILMNNEKNSTSECKKLLQFRPGMSLMLRDKYLIKMVWCDKYILRLLIMDTSDLDRKIIYSIPMELFIINFED